MLLNSSCESEICIEDLELFMTATGHLYDSDGDEDFGLPDISGW